jgi:hypothetical protein
MNIASDGAGDSLKIELGPRVNWLGAATAILLVMILFGVGIIPLFDRLKLAIDAGGGVVGYGLGILIFSCLVLLVSAGLLANLFGSEVITVSPVELRIEWLICGFVRSQRSFPNSTVAKLRYERWTSGARGDGMHNGIRFDCVGETVTFARDLPLNDSYDLIDQLRRIYAFPVADPPGEEPSESSPAVTHW